MTRLWQSKFNAPEFPDETPATGIERTSVRLEIRSLDTRSWIAGTFAQLDSQSTQVQSSRFSRS